MGDYLPVVDYPAASSLPQAAVPLVGPNACAVFPAGVPGASPSCAVLPEPTPAVKTTVTQCPAPGCSGIVAQPHPPVTITGAGFGNFPLGLPFTGNSNFLQITDSTQRWTAGYAGAPCNVGIVEWLDSSISLTANVNQNGTCPLLAGDQVTVQVWNPQTMSAPATATTTVSGN